MKSEELNVLSRRVLALHMLFMMRLGRVCLRLLIAHVLTWRCGLADFL